MNINAVLKKPTSIAVLSILAFVLSLSACATVEKRDTTSFVTTMIRFDQVFIPALAMTSKGDMNGSLKAMSILESEWAIVEPELTAFYPEDKLVAENLATVDKSIMDAKSKLAGGIPLLTVHETLEEVKKPFVDIRAAKGITYYPDLLDTYHTTMEEILSLTTGKKTSDITPEDLSSIKDLAAKGVNQWHTIQTSDFDSGLFGFNETKTENLKKSIEAGKNESLKFLALSKEGNIESILKEAAGLKPYYTKVYLQFGNFARLQK